MNLPAKLKHELRAMLAATLYFGDLIAMLLAIKSLVLAEYHIEFRHFSKAVVGALVLSKVVLILEHFSLGSWVKRQPAWVDLVLRTLYYSAGVVVVMALENGIEGRHEHDGFFGAVEAAVKNTDEPHLWANALCISGALLVYNALTVIRRNLGEGGLVRLLLAPIPDRPHPAGADSTGSIA